MTFVFDEVIQEIERLNHAQPEGFSVRELMEVAGYGKDRALKYIHHMVENGVLRHNGTRHTTNIAGYVSNIPIYTLVDR